MNDRLIKFNQDDPKEKLFGLVYSVIKRKFKDLKDADFDDACSIGFLTILEVLDRGDFNPDRKTSLSTFLWICIKNEILWQMFKKKKLDTIDPKYIGIIEKEKSENYSAKLDRWRELKVILYNRSTKKQRRILDLKAEGKGYKEIARILHCTPSNVYFFMKRIIKKGQELSNA